MSLLLQAKLLHDMDARVKDLPLQGQLQIENVNLRLFGEDSNLGYWLARNFGFIESADTSQSESNYSIAVIVSDEWLSSIIQLNDSDQFESQVLTRQFDVFKRIIITNEMTVDYFPGVGAAWITQRDQQRITLVMSSRTSLPSSELRLGLIDLIYRHMLADGWHMFHGSATRVGTNGAIILSDHHHHTIMLLCDLLKTGASFIGGDRVLLKNENGQIRARGFAQTVTVGLPVAAHFPELSGLIERPDRLSYYQKSFDSDRVWNASADEFDDLPDALKVLPEELTNALSPDISEAIVSEIALDMILVPQIEMGQRPRLDGISGDQSSELFRQCYLPPDQDSFYPHWLPISLDSDQLDPESLVTQLCNKPTWWLRYGVVRDHHQEGFSELVHRLSMEAEV